MDGWNTTFLLGRPIFRGRLLVSGRVNLPFPFPPIPRFVFHLYAVCKWHPWWRPRSCHRQRPRPSTRVKWVVQDMEVRISDSSFSTPPRSWTARYLKRKIRLFQGPSFFCFERFWASVLLLSICSKFLGVSTQIVLLLVGQLPQFVEVGQPKSWTAIDSNPCRQNPSIRIKSWGKRVKGITKKMEIKWWKHFITQEHVYLYCFNTHTYIYIHMYAFNRHVFSSNPEFKPFRS